MKYIALVVGIFCLGVALFYAGQGKIQYEVYFCSLAIIGFVLCFSIKLQEQIIEILNKP